MDNTVLVREFDPDEFHRKVLELEKRGYISRLESYRILPDMDPETGVIVHLHSIEMTKEEPREKK